jgi:hypothetical protein
MELISWSQYRNLYTLRWIHQIEALIELDYPRRVSSPPALFAVRLKCFKESRSVPSLRSSLYYPVTPRGPPCVCQSPNVHFTLVSISLNSAKTDEENSVLLRRR